MGTVIGWTSPMQRLLTSEYNPVGPDPISEDMFALISSMSIIGSGMTTIFCGRVADRLGRKVTLLLTTIPYILSWTLLLVAHRVELLLLGRFISGVGIAGTMAVAPVFIIEIAEKDLRGFLGSFLYLAINAGTFLSFVVGPYLQYYGLAVFCLFPPVCFLLTFIWFAETPVYTWRRGKVDEAEHSLIWYRGGDTISIKENISDYKSFQENEESGSFKNLFASKGTRKATLLSIFIALSLMCTGIFPIINFTASLFHMRGTSLTPNQSAVVISLLQLIASYFCSVLIERLGRKPLLLGTLLTMSLSLITLSVHLHTTDGSASWVPLVTLSTHIAAYALGGGPVALIVVTELFPSSVRCFASSLVHTLIAVLGFTTTTFYPEMLHLLKQKGLFFFYGSCCFLSAVLLYFQLPETKGVPEIEIMTILGDRTSARTEHLDAATTHPLTMQCSN